MHDQNLEHRSVISNPTTMSMGESKNQALETTSTRSIPRHSTTQVRSSLFKYYIHDGTDACRFQLLGELTEADIADLEGCWRTAKTTLGNRKLVLDLRSLRCADAAGKEWVTFMVAEGASCLALSYSKGGAPLIPSPDAVPAENAPPATRFGKLIALLRAFGLTSPESPTQAP